MKESRTVFFYNPAITGKRRISAKVWKVQIRFSNKENDATSIPGMWSISKILN
jgi:hypothetical protein